MSAPLSAVPLSSLKLTSERQFSVANSSNKQRTFSPKATEEFLDTIDTLDLNKFKSEVSKYVSNKSNCANIYDGGTLSCPAIARILRPLLPPFSAGLSDKEMAIYLEMAAILVKTMPDEVINGQTGLDNAIIIIRSVNYRKNEIIEKVHNLGIELSSHLAQKMSTTTLDYKHQGETMLQVAARVGDIKLAILLISKTSIESLKDTMECYEKSKYSMRGVIYNEAIIKLVRAALEQHASSALIGTNLKRV